MLSRHQTLATHLTCSRERGRNQARVLRKLKDLVSVGYGVTGEALRINLDACGDYMTRQLGGLG